MGAGGATIKGKWVKAYPGEPVPEEINEQGLTLGEQKVLYKLIELHNAFLEIDRQHPAEYREFIEHLHEIQGLLMERVCRRSYPKGWPAYKQVKQ